MRPTCPWPLIIPSLDSCDIFGCPFKTSSRSTLRREDPELRNSHRSFKTSNAASGVSLNVSICRRERRRSSTMGAVPAFRTSSQMTLGGAPETKARWRKSLSLERIVSPLARAYSQTRVSVAPPSPASYACALPGNKSESSETRLGLRFSSMSSFTRPTMRDVAHGQPQMPGKRECLRARDSGSPIGSRPPSSHPPGTREHRTP